jgi:hypothetical protein
MRLLSARIAQNIIFDSLKEGDAVSGDTHRSQTMEPCSLGCCNSEMGFSVVLNLTIQIHFETKFCVLYIPELRVFKINRADF